MRIFFRVQIEFVKIGEVESARFITKNISAQTLKPITQLVLTYPLPSWRFNLILNSTTFNIPLWNVNDNYQVATDFPFADESRIEVIFTRDPRFSIEEKFPFSVAKQLSLFSNEVSAPRLDILGQTLIDNTDIGNVIFTIQDKYFYYKDHLPEGKNKCGPENIKTTIFDQSCPKIVSVVKGKSNTLYKKLSDIFFELGEAKIGVPLTVFYPNIFLYAMSKYILCRILYGEFNVKFLLQKYNDKFLEDLRHSRFCEAIQIFEDPQSKVYDYNKYFKKGY